MAAWLDSNWLRIIGYLVAAAAAFWAGLRERRRQPANPDLWPTFWFLTAGFLAVMALGRAGDLAELLAELGRQRAYDEGWYETRRRYQAIAVGAVMLVWMVVVLVAIWRVPERRRRYLPMALMVFTLVCFAGIRMISLHHVDMLLYNRQIAGVKVGPIIELSLLAMTVAMTFWQPRPLPDRRASPPTVSAVRAD